MKRALLFFFVAACAQSVPVVAAVSSSNSCTTSTDCARYDQPGNLTCSNGACIASAELRGLARLQSAPYVQSTPYTLVVSVPDTAGFAPSTTLVLSNADFTLGGPPPPNTACFGLASTNTCIRMPQISSSNGTYDTDPLTQQPPSTTNSNSVGRWLGNPNTRTSLPAHTTFRQLPDGASTTTLASMGIPTLPIYAAVNSFYPLASAPAGPGGTPLISWTTYLPVGRYERDITVDPPFNDSFPPWSDVVAVPTPDKEFDGQYSEVLLNGVDNPTVRTFVIKSPAVDLTGWSAFIEETATSIQVQQGAAPHVVSSIRTFSAADAANAKSTSADVILNTPLGTDLTGTELVIAPPLGSVLPNLVDVAIGGTIPQQQLYPAVPPPALVKGGVTLNNGAVDAGAIDSGVQNASPVQAWIDFESVDGTLSPTSANVLLRYRASVHTATDGTYSIALPRGSYDVAVTPDPTTNLAVLYQVASQDASRDHRFIVVEDNLGTSDNAIQSGRGFQVMPTTPLTGRVTLTDGRPLGGVVVEARASFGQSLADVPLEFASLARMKSTTTDDNGSYVLDLDPGVYDLFAKAPASSRFAWGVTVAHQVNASSGTSPTLPVNIEVPVPLDQSMRLYDPTNAIEPVRGALVRAYVAGGPSIAGPNSSQIQPQIQIGEGTTDSNGVLTLFLPPYLPQ